MKKTLIATALAAFLAAPALAGTMTISFAADNGSTSVWVLSDDGTATGPDDLVVPYTWDEEALKLCATMPDAGEICATFDEAGTGEVGDTSTYSLSNGDTGVATVTAVTE